MHSLYYSKSNPCCLYLARDRKQHSLSLGSEADDEEVKANKDDLETMKVPKPKSNKSALEDDDDDDDDLDDKQV